MEKAIEFSCPICGSLCQTTRDKRGKQMECLQCMSQIVVPKELDDSVGLDIEYFVRAGVVKQTLKSDAAGGPAAQPSKAATPVAPEQPATAATGDRARPATADKSYKLLDSEDKPEASSRPSLAPDDSAARTRQTQAQASPAPAQPSPPAALPAGEPGPTPEKSEEPERLLFRDTVKLDGKNLPLAISNRKIEGRGLLPIPAEQLCGMRLEVTPKRDRVTGEIRYYGPHRDVRKCSIEITRLVVSKVSKVTGEFLAAMEQVLGPEVNIELVDQDSQANEPFWDQLRGKKAKPKG